MRVHAGQKSEAFGTMVEDFGDMVGSPVTIGTTHITDPAQRSAIMLDTVRQTPKL